MRFATLYSAIILALLAAGCGFTPDVIIVQPDSPVLIAEFRGKYVRLFAHQKSSNKMIEKGWMPTSDYVGYTMVRFDWDSEIAKGMTDARTDGSSSP